MCLRYALPEEGYRCDHALYSPIFVLTINALIRIEIKPEGIAEFEFPTGSYWQDCLKEKQN